MRSECSPALRATGRAFERIRYVGDTPHAPPCHVQAFGSVSLVFD